MQRFAVLFTAALYLLSPGAFAQNSNTQVLTGNQAFTNYQKEHPGVTRHLTLSDLPQPYATPGVDNGPTIVKRPDNAWPTALPGFKVSLYYTGLDQPRLIRTAPNGDLFVAISYQNKIMVFRGVGPDGKPKTVSTFADQLTLPFGIRFYPAGPNPKWVYIGDTDAVVRFPYHNGDLKATGPAQQIAELPGWGKLRGGGHWTRDIAFSRDGTKMLVSVGSHSNVMEGEDPKAEYHRADVLEFTPEGKFLQVYASGIRNCVGEAVNPITGQLWCSVNERDMLGDDLVPDYITHVQEGGFYGWPWFYMGGHWDPRHKGEEPTLKSKVITPDVLLEPHFASLEMLFYPTTSEFMANPVCATLPSASSCPARAAPKNAFPAEYRGDIFAAEHGSWNRSRRAGYEVIVVPMKHGHAINRYEDFLTGFVLPDGKVWGRPVGVAMANDGSLFVTDDASGSIWHVTYMGR